MRADGCRQMTWTRKSKYQYLTERMNRLTFEQMAHRLRPRIIQIAFEFFESMDDAEDVAQDSLIRLWGLCEKLDEGRNIEALAVRVAKSVCVDAYRRQRLKTISMSEDDEGDTPKGTPTDASPSPHEMMEAEEMQNKIDMALQGLNKRERQLFEMRQMEGLTTEEISQQVGIPKASVQSMISMARKKLFKALR